MQLLLIAAMAWNAALASSVHAAQVVIDGPVGSGRFGSSVTTLPNGNIVVTDPRFDAPGPIADVGAVYLYRPNGTLISTVRGSSTNDLVGEFGVVVLANGNFVVLSPNWSSVGAVTFGSAVSGISGAISPANSLVGSTPGDEVGSTGVTALANGNYVVASLRWDNGAIINAGAVTFGSGVTGVSGEVSAATSLVGGTTSDFVGSVGVTALANGNYVVRSPGWDNGTIVNAGAATFGSGVSGISGVVSPANSLVGSTAGDQVGIDSVTALVNGNYVVASQSWDNGPLGDAGAVTFGSGVNGISGVVSPANSLVGSTASDRIGSAGVTALTNGNYVVRSPNWRNGAAPNAGAVTFGSGVSGVSGAVSAATSLVGDTTSDLVGSAGVTALANGNYVVRSPAWDNGTFVNVGAATFGSGVSGISGVVSPANSLVGSRGDDQVGDSGVTALANGNYVVASLRWDNGPLGDAGAVTFGSGVNGISGLVSPANSLVGSTVSDRIGGFGVTALANGNYVVRSPNWRNGAAANAGAVTFGSGVSGVSGEVSAATSLVGGTTSDLVGISGVSALANGNYVVASQFWDDDAIVDVGAVTFGSGASGISGVVSRANSLVGSTANDQVGEFGPTALANSNYVVGSRLWDNGTTVDAGAITLCLANGSVTGPITSTHSVLGLVADQGSAHTFSYDAFRNQLAVGQRASNRVVLQRTGTATAISIVGDTPDPSIGGQPVNFTATVSASRNVPIDGEVTFSASSGESCVATAPTPTSATTADFSCTIVFTANGSATVIAEYTGSIIHAYTGSGPETHTTIVPIFANGFESP